MCHSNFAPMKLKAYNIEELRCDTFMRIGKHFYVCRYEEFIRSTTEFTKAHRHNYYMLLLATEGSGSMLVDFKSFEIKKQMAFLMYPGMIHAWERDEEMKGFLIFFTPDFFTMRYHNNNLLEFPFFNSSYATPYVKLKDVVATRMNNLLGFMLGEYERNEINATEVLRSYLNVFLLECNRNYEAQFDIPTQDQHARAVVKRLEQLIDKNFIDKRQIKDYAAMLKISPNHLNATVKQSMQKTVGELIRMRVILEAKRLLLHEDKTVSEIAADLNFKDNAYFCRFFKRHEQVSPNEFRKNVL